MLEQKEKEFLDYVNTTPKQLLRSSVDLGALYVLEQPVAEFIAMCHEVLLQMPENMRAAAVVFIDDYNIEFRSQRKETSDEHIARCREEFDRAHLAKANRRLMYEQLKKEFGDA